MKCGSGMETPSDRLTNHLAPFVCVGGWSPEQTSGLLHVGLAGQGLRDHIWQFVSELQMLKNQGRFSSVFKVVCGFSSEYVDTLGNVTGLRNLKLCCRADKNKIEPAGHVFEQL